MSWLPITHLARDLGREQVRDGSLRLQWRWAILEYYEWFFDDPDSISLNVV